jgi:hypothetical protein
LVVAQAERAMKPFSWEFSLNQGRVNIEAPQTIDVTEVEELEELFRIIVRTLMRHALRSVANDEVDPSSDPDAGEARP